MTSPQRPPAPNFELQDGVESIYINLVRISHSATELVMDFASMLPGQTNPRVLSRILMSPIGAKLFYRALGENLARYEATFGEIYLPGDVTLATELFRPPQPPEAPGPNGPSAPLK